MSTQTLNTSHASAKLLRFQVAKDLELVADAYGEPSARPVLLLHGGGQTRHAWGGTAAALAAAGFYAISVDLRGHGDSTWAPDGDYEISRFAEDIAAMASSLPSKPALVGASLGGLASMICEGEVASGSASAVVLVDVTPRLEPAGVERILAFMRAYPEGFASIEEAADAVAEYLPHRRRPSDTSGLAKNLRRNAEGRLCWHWDPRFLGDRPRTAQPEYHARMDNAAAALDVPVLLVRGRMSEIVSEESVRHFQELVPHAEYADVQGAAHMVAGDRNDAFRDAVEAFLRKLP